MDNASLKTEGVRGLSSSMLKLLAVAAMLTDHIGHILLPYISAAAAPLFTVFGREISAYLLFRKIGRLAFPIYCFLIAEGFVHTHDRKKYGLRLLCFALISEIPFNLMFANTWLYAEHQNVFFTLFAGFLCLCILDSVEGNLRKFLLLLAVLTPVSLARLDYGLRGVLLIILLYVLRDQSALKALLSYPLLSGGTAAWCAFLPISLYNGKRGFIQKKWMKYLFYAFYPLHILALVLLRYLLFLR